MQRCKRVRHAEQALRLHGPEVLERQATLPLGHDALPGARNTTSQRQIPSCLFARVHRVLHDENVRPALVGSGEVPLNSSLLEQLWRGQRIRGEDVEARRRQ
eukprot:5749037-Pyramimonas_sp.AAC.1